MKTCRQHTQNPRAATRLFAKILTLTAILTLSLTATIALAQNAVPLINQPLVPEQANPGAKKAITLTVNGTGFASDAVVRWNGTALTTTFVSEAQVTASVPTSDLATAQTANITVLNGTGAESNVAHFQVTKNGYTTAFSALPYATDTDPQDVTTADFNGDGIADLAVATGNNTVSILLGAGGGSFPTHVQYPVPGNPVAIVNGDFTGTGIIDLATADQYTGQVSVLLGNGDGTFQPHVEYSVGHKPVALAVADVNGDGKLDLVVVNENDNTISVLLGNGDGTFQAQKTYTTNPTGVTSSNPLVVCIGDFNGDGKLDLAVANNNDNAVAILLGNGDGSFQAPVEYPTAIEPNSVVTGAFVTGNTTLDLAVGTSNKAVSVLLGNGNGTFQNHKEYGIGANAVVVGLADLSSSGKLSIISANTNDNSVSTLLGNGDGTFKSQSVFPVGSAPTGLAVADFNSDGKLDIAVVNSNSNNVSILSDSWITVSPGLVSFGTQTSGEPSAVKDITIKNAGTTPWTMGAISYQGTDYTDFSTSTNTCPASGANLAAGASCTIGVIFEPTACETADAQILITTSNGATYGNVLQGNGNIPLTLSPRTQTFPTTLLFTTSAAKSNTFTNESGVNIVFSKIDLEGVNQNDFAIEPTSTCMTLPNATLAPGASCTSNVTFTPTMQPPGNETVTQVYYGNFCLVKQGLLINGEGTAVKVSPTSITFPSTTVGTTSTSVVTIQNAGTTALPITSASFPTGTAPVFSIQSNTCNYVQGTGGSVPASGSCTFTLAFTPTATGTQTATFAIGDPDPTGPQQVSLSGTGD